MKAILKQVNIIPTLSEKEIKTIKKEERNVKNLEVEYLIIESPVVNYLTSRIV